MRIGLVFPQTEFPADPGAIRDYALLAEALGFTHILAYDHILGANPLRPGGWQGPYTHRDPFQEPLALFSYWAAITRRLEFTTGVIILPQRQTALFAKQAATLDVLSGGRLRVGVGLGWNAVEYTAQNEDFHNRGRRMEEQVQLLRRLWTEPLVTFQGRWHTIADAGLNPLPVQRPIPLWFGGHVDQALQRAARLADGWMPGHRTAEDAAPALEKLERYLAEAGRSRQGFGIEPRIPYGDGDAHVWQRVLDGWRAAGATHLSLNTMGHGFDTPEKHFAAIRLFADAARE
ncbi:MAG: LLM class F420-dependent oxidoreductase [Chloroflexota bacterium]